MKEAHKSLLGKIFLSDSEKTDDIKLIKKALIRANCFLLMAVILFVSTLLYYFYKDQQRNRSKFRALEVLAQSYYKQDNLDDVMKATLGDAFIEESKENFPNYLIKLVTDDLATLEEDKWRGFTFFVPTYQMNKIRETTIGRAEEAVYEAYEDYYYIRLGSFQNNITEKLLGKHLNEIQGYSNLILDLRGNSGGHADSLIKVLDFFFEKGQVMIKNKTFNYHEEIVKEYRAKTKKHIDFERIIILADERTASCSELMIISLQESFDNVIVIGENTYGKGIGMSVRQFKDGSGLIYINAYWYGPKGGNPTDEVIRPDIVVDPSKALDEAVKYIVLDKLN